VGSQVFLELWVRGGEELAAKIRNFIRQFGYEGERWIFSLITLCSPRLLTISAEADLAWCTEDFLRGFPEPIRSGGYTWHPDAGGLPGRHLARKNQGLAGPGRRQSKKLKDLGDIARLVESHPHLWQWGSIRIYKRLLDNQNKNPPRTPSGGF